MHLMVCTAFHSNDSITVLWAYLLPNRIEIYYAKEIHFWNAFWISVDLEIAEIRDKPTMAP